MHPVLAVDFGAQYAQLIVRRVCEANVYSEIVPHTVSVADMLAKEPAAIILSGDPSFVYEEGAPSVDPVIFGADVPVLGICCGFQTVAHALGDTVGRTDTCKYGRIEATVAGDSYLFGGIPDDQIVWMSHSDAVQGAPEGFTVTASATETPVATFESRERRLYGLQWHPEVGHSQFSQDALKNFLYEEAGLEPTQTAGSIVDEQVAKIREQVGDTQVICALSGGMNPSVTAALVHRAVGDQLTYFFIDHGLLRADGRKWVENDYTRDMSIHAITCGESERFLPTLTGVTEPEAKHKIIDRKLIRSFEATRKQVIEEVGAADGEVESLVQGTLYPNVVESGGDEGATNIKSHHNVGDLPEDMTFELVEPLRILFKDEVHVVDYELGLPDYLTNHQSFPGPDLGIRIISGVTHERLDILRTADLIAHKELAATGLDQEIWQYPVALLANVRSVGIQGDGYTYGHPVMLHPASSEDAMTADWTCPLYDTLARVSTRVTNSVPEVNRVVLDVTSKPPATIE